MTAELIYRFTKVDEMIQTQRIALVDDADLSERMAITVAMNAMDASLRMLHGKEPDWDNNHKYTPDEIAESKKEVELKTVAATNTKKRIEELSLMAMDAGQAVIDLCDVVEYAVGGLDSITERKNAKDMREIARDVIKNIRVKMEEFNKQHKVKED